MLYYFLPAILALGIITSYEDIKYGKIRNKWVILALVYAIAMYIFLILSYYFSGRLMSQQYLIELASNAIFALLIGFLMWITGLWTAGDGKLFLAYSALLPLSVYSLGYVRYFPSITILINTFVPVFLFFFLILLFRTAKKQKISSLKSIFEPKGLLNSLISLFAVFWVIQLLFSLIKISNYFLNIFISILAFFSLKRLFQKNLIKITAFIAILRLAIDPGIYSVVFIKQFSMLVIFWILIRGFILDLGYQLFTKEIKIDKLKIGLVLAENIYKEKKVYKKEQAGLFSFLNKKYLLKLIAEGLTKKDIDKIKRLHKEKKLGFKTIKIQQILPFAPFIFLGVLLTLLAKGNILVAIRAIIDIIY